MADWSEIKYKNTLSKSPFLGFRSGLVGFMSCRSEVIDSDFLWGFTGEEFPENLLSPLLILPAVSCMPAV